MPEAASDHVTFLAGQYVLITGASRGIGAELAVALAKAGAHVILVARTVGGLEETDDRIQAEGGQATLVPMDLRHLDSVDLLAHNVAERFGRLDIWIANAGILGGLQPLHAIENKVWHETLTVNLEANFRLLRALHPLLMVSEKPSIIGVTAEHAQSHEPFWGLTSVTKAALEALFTTYANEQTHNALDVKLIDPGLVETKWSKAAYPGRSEGDMPSVSTCLPRFMDYIASRYA